MNHLNEPPSLADKIHALQSATLEREQIDANGPVHASEQPEQIETHISVLFLTDHHVYKLKKDINLGFLDFSTLEQRKRACETEVDINRRLAPDVYEGTVPVNQNGNGRISLGGDGQTIDWLVKMKRLPENRCFIHHIHDVQELKRHLPCVVDQLTSFYRVLEPISKEDYVDDFRQHVIHNTGVITDSRYDLPSTTAHRVSALQRWFLFVQEELLHRRVASGHVVEGHGDLRAEHIYLTQPPTIIDGIEFDRQLRILDVADELSFLAVTCQFRGASNVGQDILARVCANLQDSPPDSLLDFYRAYRATVRAKVAALRFDQSEGESKNAAHSEALRYLEIADEFSTRLGPLPAIIVRGRSGTGKTTLAKALADETGGRHIATDKRRRSLAVPRQADLYSESARDQIYTEVIDQATEQWDEGKLVILDGTFLQSKWLDRAIQALAVRHARVLVVTCNCPESVAIERVRLRAAKGGSESDADEEVLKQQTDEINEFPQHVTSISIDTHQELDQQLQSLQSMIAGSGDRA